MRDEPSRTAEAVCLFRATDQRRPRDARIVDDPYARLFLGPMSRAVLATIEATGRLGELAEEHTPGLLAYVLCRHRFIDDALARALDGPIEQIVILGAGYDTRAYRFTRSLGGRHVYELDFPSTSRRKRRILEEHRTELPSQPVVRIEIDFEHEHIDEVLLAAGFSAERATFFVWEGVAMYLTREAVKATLGELREIAALGSEIALDLWRMPEGADLVAATHRLSASALHLIGEPVTFAIHPEDAGPLLERLGYRVLEIAETESLRLRYVHDGRRVHDTAYLVHAATAGARR